MDPQPDTMPAASDAHERRTKQLRRAYQKQLGRKGTVVELSAIDRAVALTVRAEQAAADPTVSANDLVRLDNAAARARASMFDLIAAKPAPTLGPNSLRDYVASKRQAVPA